jgi:hypothetical protein
MCKGDYKAVLRVVLIANRYHKQEIERLRQEASAGYGRGKTSQAADGELERRE